MKSFNWARVVGSSFGSLIAEERGILKHFEKPAHLDLRIDVSASYLGNLVDELLEIDMREPVRKLLDMRDDLTKDVMIVKVCRLWRWDVVEGHVSRRECQGSFCAVGERMRRDRFTVSTSK
jgi:hypothetical protein